MTTKDNALQTARVQFIRGIHELHEELEDALKEETMDPARVMRLTAHGVDYCMVAIASLLEDQDNNSD